MRILFFIDNLGPGGKERRFTELLKALSKDTDIAFEIVVMSEEIHYSEIQNLNIKIHYLIRKRKKDLSVFRKFYLICKSYQPNIVHCWDDMTAIISVPSCKLLKIKLVNGMVIDTPVKKNIFNKSWLRAKLTFPFSTKIVGNSMAGLNAYGAPFKKSVCIYNGMDFKRFINLKDRELMKKDILGLNSDHLFIVGMVAGFDSRKDYKTLISTAIELVQINDNLRFILVGSGKELEERKNSIPVALKERIIFLGKRKDVESIINIFDVGVLLTNSKVHGEGVSNSLIEYMASGKPVIASKGGGTNEVIHHGENGYLINYGNENQLKECILYFLNNRDSIINYGAKSYEIAKNKFNLKTMCSNYKELYLDLT